MIMLMTMIIFMPINLIDLLILTNLFILNKPKIQNTIFFKKTDPIEIILNFK
jgi:hypothetical protein